ncbi:HAD-IA family hydrolase [Streptomyces cinnamoneus]|uniref:Phosphatase n=1 Tax=Streptomyces cinnamoneus TaxID=53446 RepID=A0A918TD11_STRCJ|nr:HAD-IA family hydrolase [Streptomyces cinnamoneus]GHC39803.1 phosphatase [Streptomyces cinnamoneus]
MHFSADALLFDSDETLVHSVRTVVPAWTRWVESYGLTPEDVLRVGFHGRPAAAIAGDLLPAGQVPEALRRLEDAEVAAASGVTPVPGAVELLASLPSDRWAVVTSGTRRVAMARLTRAGITPECLIAVEDAPEHKPHPAPFLVAAERLGVDPARCIVVEDAPVGLEAARAAGMATIALTTTHLEEELKADAVAADLTAVTVRITETGGLEVVVG